MLTLFLLYLVRNDNNKDDQSIMFSDPLQTCFIMVEFLLRIWTGRY